MSSAGHQPRITDDRILQSAEPERPSAEVEAAFHGGWQPFGPLAVEGTADGQGASVTCAQTTTPQSEWFR